MPTLLRKKRQAITQIIFYSNHFSFLQIAMAIYSDIKQTHSQDNAVTHILRISTEKKWSSFLMIFLLSYKTQSEAKLIIS
jgi:hypothetical protein